jgi:hypothetical protein
MPDLLLRKPANANGSHLDFAKLSLASPTRLAKSSREDTTSDEQDLRKRFVGDVDLPECA